MCKGFDMAWLLVTQVLQEEVDLVVEEVVSVEVSEVVSSWSVLSVLSLQ